MDSILENKPQSTDLTDNTIERFENLLKIAIDLKLERLKFQDCCKDWCFITDQASTYITQVETELVNVNHTTNCVSLGGVSTAIIGTVMGIAGITLALPTAGTSLLLTVGGTSATAVGGGLSIGSNIIKNRLSRCLCEKAKKALDQATELTEKLEKQRTTYFDTLFEFKDCVEKLTETELQATSFQLEEWSSFTEFQFDEGTQRYLHPTVKRMKMMESEKIKSKEERIVKLIYDIINTISEDPLAKKLLSLIKENDLLQKLLPMVDFNSAFRSTEESAKFIFQSSVAVYKLVNDSKVTIKATLKSMSKTVRVGIGFLNVLFLAWGMFDLVITSINVHNGSKSNESEQLSKIVKEMKEYREEVMHILKEIFNWDFANDKKDMF